MLYFDYQKCKKKLILVGKMDQPPAQDSTKHILNVLNDDCIEEIFRRIFFLEDFLNMAEVCQRFQQSAKNCFRMQFKCVYLDGREKDLKYSLPSERAIPFLNAFGPFIRELKWRRKWENESTQKYNDDIFKSIVKFTGKTLKELYIEKYSPDFAQTQFSALEILRLHQGIPKNFEQVPPLKGLEYIDGYIDGISNFISEYHFFMRTMSRLEWFFLSSKIITDDIICEFLSLNPQLQRLNLFKCNKLTSFVLKAIADNLINLVELCFSSMMLNRTPFLLNRNLEYLGALRQLKYIEIDLNTTILFKTMINTVAKNKIPIESMKIRLRNDEKSKIDPSYQLLTIKTLKYFDFVRFPRKNCFNDLMINILKTQTGLESIRIICLDDIFDDEPLPMLEIRNVLRYGERLSKFECHVIKLEVNLESYESVLCLVKNRCRTKILIAHARNNCIPDDILAKNGYESEWLEVRYLREDDPYIVIYVHDPQ